MSRFGWIVTLSLLAVVVHGFKPVPKFRFRTQLRVGSPVLEKDATEIDLTKVVADASQKLMKRFWEIDLQTKKRMDKILKLYEVRFHIQIIAVTLFFL
jgi:hypothetical protein